MVYLNLSICILMKKYSNLLIIQTDTLGLYWAREHHNETIL